MDDWEFRGFKTLNYNTGLLIKLIMMFNAVMNESSFRKKATSIFDYGKIFGALLSDAVKNLFMTPHPNTSKTYFELFGFPDPASHVRFPIIMKLCNPKKSDLILDIGCGLGVYSNTIAMKLGAKCIGIDLNKENLRKASLVSDALKLNTAFRLMDATKLEFPSEQFDKVLCIEVLEHIQDDGRILAEIARLLKPGGFLVLSTPMKDMSDEKERTVFKHPKPLEHVRSGYYYTSLKANIQKVNLKIIGVEYWYRWFTKQALKVLTLFYHRKRLTSIVFIYPFLIPLELLDKVHERITHEKGWYRGYIILASKPHRGCN